MSRTYNTGKSVGSNVKRTYNLPAQKKKVSIKKPIEEEVIEKPSKKEQKGMKRSKK